MSTKYGCGRSSRPSSRCSLRLLVRETTPFPPASKVDEGLHTAPFCDFLFKPHHVYRLLIEERKLLVQTTKQSYGGITHNMVEAW